MATISVPKRHSQASRASPPLPCRQRWKHTHTHTKSTNTVRCVFMGATRPHMWTIPSEKNNRPPSLILLSFGACMVTIGVSTVTNGSSTQPSLLLYGMVTNRLVRCVGARSYGSLVLWDAGLKDAGNQANDCRHQGGHRPGSFFCFFRSAASWMYHGVTVLGPVRDCNMRRGR